MMIAVNRPDVAPLPRRFTVADLAAMPDELPSGPVLYELDNGRLITMPPPGYGHGAVEAKIVTDLTNQGERRGLGEVGCGDVGVVLWRDPDRVVGADVVFITRNKLPARRSPEGYLETMPDLVVEVRSRNDTQPYIERKVGDYLAAGVRVVWVPDPEQRTVTAYRRDQPPQVFTEDDTLTLEDVIPGLQILVRNLF